MIDSYVYKLSMYIYAWNQPDFGIAHNLKTELSYLIPYIDTNLKPFPLWHLMGWIYTWKLIYVVKLIQLGNY